MPATEIYGLTPSRNMCCTPRMYLQNSRSFGYFVEVDDERGRKAIALVSYSFGEYHFDTRCNWTDTSRSGWQYLTSSVCGIITVDPPEVAEVQSLDYTCQSQDNNATAY